MSIPADPEDPRSQHERLVAGDWYCSDEELGALQRRAARLADRYHRAWLEESPEAGALLAELLGGLGEGTRVRPPLSVDYGSNVTIGARAFVNYHLTAADVAPITVGEDCQIGPNVQLLTPIHPTAPEPRRDGWERAAPITIGNNVWLGGGVTVLPGVTIGDNSVIGAAAVVTRDVPANVVAVGSPARVVRAL
ncbi:sugar O-acetyltransferase [Brachybacterium saurashtrense]|uniref:Sugar O-acetyltransferase n=1 Tax=Brachybacterium saurashtrense TaxID=556288 RepID=A0A345YRV7_9MICO|nr:sugar O-acetyltransferase [Brachybacterium saurashtrense]AXK46659.1 sugar O-acetyltransferase [Brachybacterium saurashtrense]RRR22373.1 sugar O-acetyltransferase [Brachybacterium saurashtrense]